MSLTWPSLPGYSYLVQTAATLAGPWLPVTTVAAAVAPAVQTTFTDPTPAGGLEDLSRGVGGAMNVSVRGTTPFPDAAG